jgi:hypothetical protein
MATKKTAKKKTVATEANAVVKTTTVKKVAATKKAAVKKTAVKKAATKKTVPATVPTPVAASPVTQPEVIAPATTTIVAKCDCGFGNSLFLRGEGAGLSWESGVPMENSGADEWTWSSSEAVGEIEVKVLRNDSEWAVGDNITVPAGTKSVIEPTF